MEHKCADSFIWKSLWRYHLHCCILRAITGNKGDIRYNFAHMAATFYTGGNEDVIPVPLARLNSADVGLNKCLNI
uniref:Uncharacterized protein n=1 Tax=Syphacia muris TaxID=451379 RepID=A0A0N5AD72_9BILA